MLQPMKNYLIIRPIEEKELTHGTLKLLAAETSMERPKTGEVIATAEGEERIQEGQSVVFNRYSGMDFKDGEMDVLILQVDDVLAVIK